MHTTTSASARSTPLVTSRLAAPPPSQLLDLYDADMIVGWIDGGTIGFRGFADEKEAMHAAWVAYRAVARRFARQSRRRPVPVGTEPLSLGKDGDTVQVLAGGRSIATLVRPGADSRSGPESFGFEFELPVPPHELTTRSTAYFLYRTLRRSGIRWALWARPRSEAAPPPHRAAEQAEQAEQAEPAAARQASLWGVAATVIVVLAMLAVIALPAITTSNVVLLLGGTAALLALLAASSLVRLVVADARDGWLEGRAARPRLRRSGLTTAPGA